MGRSNTASPKASRGPGLPDLQGLPLGWRPAGAILGLAPAGDNELLLSESSHGVDAISANSRTSRSTWTVSGSSLELCGPAVYDPVCQHIVAPVRTPASGADSLAAWPCGAPTGRLDAFPRLQLGGQIAALHVLEVPVKAGAQKGLLLAIYRSGECILVSCDSLGTLALADMDADSVYGQEGTSYASSAVLGKGLAAVAVRKTSGAFRVKLVRASGDTPAKVSASDLKSLAKPTPLARICGMAGGLDKLSILWSDGTWQVISLQSDRIMAQLHLSVLQRPDDASAHPTPSKKGKKRGAAGNGDLPPSSNPLTMARLGPSFAMVTGYDAQHRTVVAILDTVYGGIVSVAHAPGEASDKPGERAVHGTALGSQHETCVVAAGRTVTFFDPQLPAPSLASLVGSLKSDSLPLKLLVGNEALSLCVGPKASHSAPAWSESVLRAEQQAQKDTEVAQGIRGPQLFSDAAETEGESTEATALRKLQEWQICSAAGAKKADIEKLLKPLMETDSVSSAVRSMAAVQLASAGSWAFLHNWVLKFPLDSMAAAPDLPTLLLQGHQYNLLAVVLPKSADIGPEQIVSVASGLLEDSSKEAKAARQSHVSALLKEVEILLAAAEGYVGGDEKKRTNLVANAVAAVAAVDGFTAEEVCLHCLVAADHSPMALTASVQSLSSATVLRLLQYLTKWMKRIPKLSDKAKAFSTAFSYHKANLPGLICPTEAQVVKWLSTTIDCHMAALIHQQEARQAVQQLSSCVSRDVQGLAGMMRLEGACMHLKSQLPLPSRQNATSKMYSIELLDTRVK